MSQPGFGIVRIGLGHPWYLGYATHGACRWLPEWVQRFIVTAWNRTICAFNGHVPFDDDEADHHVPCLHCGLRPAPLDRPTGPNRSET